MRDLRKQETLVFDMATIKVPRVIRPTLAKLNIKLQIELTAQERQKGIKILTRKV